MTLARKTQVVLEFCAKKALGSVVAEKRSVSQVSLYNWKHDAAWRKGIWSNRMVPMIKKRHSLRELREAKAINWDNIWYCEKSFKFTRAFKQ